MEKESLMMLLLAIAVLAVGTFLAVKGNPSMIRDKFSSGVSPQNERKFMMCTGGGVCIMGLDLLVLSILDSKITLKQEDILGILAVGLILFVGIILYGQKHYRR